MNLRPYQCNAVGQCFRLWSAGILNLMIVAAVGAGKTIIAATIIEQHLKDPRNRVLFLAHREELLEQTVEKLALVAPHIIAGIEQGKNYCPDNAQVMVASVATLRKIERLTRWCKLSDITLVIVDEAHHSTSSSYIDIIYEISKANPARHLLGITATPVRLDGESLSLIYDTLAFRIDLIELIDLGFLCPIRGYTIRTRTNIATLPVNREGEFDVEKLAAAIDNPYRNQVIVESYLKFGENRPTIAFVANVAHAEHLAQEFRQKGIKAQAVHGKMTKDARKAAIRGYQTGKITVLTNCMVLTEGFDAPHTGCVITARPTKSPVVYPQSIGRGLRLHSSKKDCIVIDLVDLCSQTFTLPRIFKMPEKMILNGENVRQLQRTAERALEYHPEISWEVDTEFTAKDIQRLLQPPDFFHLADIIVPNRETAVSWISMDKQFVCVVDSKAGRIARLSRDDLGDWHLNFASTHVRLGGSKQTAIFSATQALLPLLLPEERVRVSSQPAEGVMTADQQPRLRDYQIPTLQLEKLTQAQATLLLQKLDFVKFVFRSKGQMQQGKYVGQHHEIIWFFDPDYMAAVARINRHIAERIEPIHTLHWLKKNRPELFEGCHLPAFDELVKVCRERPNRYHSLVRNAMETSPEFHQMKIQLQKHRSLRWVPKATKTSHTE
jgi:superfamily II DNA or RNA helicase